MKLLVITFCTLFLWACSNDNPQIEQTIINPVTIGKHYFSSSTYQVAEQKTIISNFNDWDLLLTAMGEHQMVNISEIDINFEEYMVLAVFDQSYPNFGHTIDITSIVENRNEIVVTVENLSPGNDLSTFCQPYHIVRIPKTDKPIVFEMFE